MSKITLDTSDMAAIGDAIRTKLDVETAYKAGEMPAAILSIPSGGVTPTGTISIDSNGTYDVTQYATANVDVSGGGALYTNGYAPGAQLTNIADFTKIYDSSIKYGNYGAKVSAALGITDETTLNTHMNSGWNGTGSCYYDSENLIGAYAGYSWANSRRLSIAKFWLGRYSGQNKTLIATIEYLDANGVWNEIVDFEITPIIPYPLNVFEIVLPQVEIYGLRLIHRKGNIKSSNNNFVFFGMTLYEATNVRIYYTDQAGMNNPPTGYDGFGPIYIIRNGVIK